MDGTNFIVPHWRPQDSRRAAWSWTRNVALVVALSAATVLMALALAALLDASGMGAAPAETACTPWAGCIQL